MRRAILKFQDEMEKIPSNFTEMKRQFEKFSKTTFTPDEAKVFVGALLNYIDIIVWAFEDQEPKIQIKQCRKWFYVLLSVVRFDIGEAFLERITPRIFHIVLEDNTYTWCVKNEALKIFLACMEQLPNVFRRKAAHRLPKSSLNKIFKCISAYGDYDFQDTLIGTVFYIFGKQAVVTKLLDLIPQSRKLRDSFAAIKRHTIFEDTRRFLNNFNDNSKKIFSVACEAIFLGDAKCGRPTESMGGFWVDFNLSENAVSWYCANRVKNDAQPPNMILFFESDLEAVRYRRSSTTREATVHFKLKAPYVSYERQARETWFDVRFVVSLDSDRATVLFERVLPVMFADKYHSIPETSPGTGADHEPPGRSGRRSSMPARPEAESDGSGSADGERGARGGSERLDPACSAGATLEVIAISDESAGDDEPCPDAIRNAEQDGTVELRRSEPGPSTCRPSRHQTTEGSPPGFPNGKETKISGVKRRAVMEKRPSTSRPPGKSQREADLDRNESANEAEPEPSTSANIPEHAGRPSRDRERDEARSTEDTGQSRKGTGCDAAGGPNPDANKENWTRYQCYKKSDTTLILRQMDELLASLSHLSRSMTNEDELGESEKNDPLEEQKEEGELVEVEERSAPTDDGGDGTAFARTTPCGGRPSHLEKSATCTKKQAAGIGTKRKIRRPAGSRRSVRMAVRGQSVSGLRHSFNRMLGGFRGAANATFSGTLQFNLTMNESGLPSRRAKKKNIRKGVKRLRSTTEEAPCPAVGAAKKINVISVVRLVPEPAPRKKMKIADSGTGGPESTADDEISD